MHSNNQKQQLQPVPANEFGKIPPQVVELEEDVLGALMIENNAIDSVIDILKPEMFYKSANQKVYEAIIELYRNGNPIDMHTVTEQLRKNGTLEEVGGPYYITFLTTRISTSAHIVFHSLIIQQKYQAREIIRMTGEIQAQAFDETKDIADVFSELELGLTEIRLDTSTGVKNMNEVVDMTRDYLIELRKANEQGKRAFVRTPVTELDALLKGGFKNKKLIVVGARPGVGKTQFILETIKKLDYDKHALFFNLEMDAIELCIRLLLEEEAIDDYSVETGTYTNEELQLIDSKLQEIEMMNVSIVDDEYDIHGIISKCRKEKRNNANLSVIFIDYLQLIETDIKFQNKNYEVGYFSRKLKQLSKELNLPIILLSQLNREAKGEPTLEQLRDSGSIEQDADVVILIDRPIMRGVENDINDNTSWEQAGQYILAKNRQGRIGKVKFSHDKRYKRIFSFRDISTLNEFKNFEREVPPTWKQNTKFGTKDLPF
jgi:replicative DNA helicase